MTQIDFPQAHCRAGAARRDITPPVGIYHRMWGAATYDRATGVHRPLAATALSLVSLDAARPQRRVVVGIDHCLLWAAEMDALRASVLQATGLAPAELHIAFSHTHAAGLMDRSRAELPGGELIGPYLDRMAVAIAEAVTESLSNLQEAWITHGTGRCDLAVNRDQVDNDSHQIVCGLNPTGPTDDLLPVARIASAEGRTIATVVNYACHPTTLAWKNTLISPDYVGALREVVEGTEGGLCLFLQGASGDLGPRDGYVGEPEVADRNGRQVGHAALSVLATLPREPVTYRYAGAVVSGATIGTWDYARLTEREIADKSGWLCRDWTLDVPYRKELPTADETRRELACWLKKEGEAQRAGDALAARDCRAQVERMNRQLTRTGQLPPGPTFPLPISLWKLGDGFWLFLEGEYYNLLQRVLRERAAPWPLIVSTVVDGWRPAYLPTRETYGRGIYQEQVAVLAPGCLEMVIDAVAAQMAAWQAE